MISVIICTHNPNLIKLNRVLDALKNQSLNLSCWELIVVDNGSVNSVKDQINLAWQPRGRVIFEGELGLTNARIAGISNANGELLVFVDDDNVLDVNYLKIALKLSKDYPNLGCFGGNQIGEFEITPPKKILTFIEHIAVRSINTCRISNLYEWNTTPSGAGQVIRREIALSYVKNVLKNQARRQLDRKGASLASSGDIDMAYTSIDLGFLNGLFPELTLIHIIPKERLTEEYFIKLQFYNEMSNCILEFERFNKWPNGEPKIRFLNDLLIDLFHFRFFYAKMALAKRNGLKAAIKIVSAVK